MPKKSDFQEIKRMLDALNTELQTTPFLGVFGKEEVLEDSEVIFEPINSHQPLEAHASDASQSGSTSQKSSATQDHVIAIPRTVQDEAVSQPRYDQAHFGIQSEDELDDLAHVLEVPDLPGVAAERAFIQQAARVTQQLQKDQNLPVPQNGSVPEHWTTAIPVEHINRHLSHYARQYLDVQKIRIAMLLRVKHLMKDADKGGFSKFSFAIAENTEGKSQMIDQIKEIEKIEKQLGQYVERLGKGHFMYPWIMKTPGFGLLTFGLLIGVTGSLDRFLNPAKLWKYLGMDVRPDGMAPRRTRGQKLGYSPQGRVICHYIGSGIIKASGGAYEVKDKQTKVVLRHVKLALSPYRQAYDFKREQYLARPRIGPSQCPFGQIHKAKATAETPGGTIPCGNKHVHIAAMRFATKSLLKDLWVAWQERMPT